MLSKAQIRLLESLKLNEWTLSRDFPDGTNSSTVRKLVTEKKCLIVEILKKDTLTDDNVKSGKVECLVRKLIDPSYSSFFIKKIDESYKTDADNSIELMQSKVAQMEKQIEDQNNLLRTIMKRV